MYKGRGKFKEVTKGDFGKTSEMCRWFLSNVNISKRHKKKVIRIFNNMDSDFDRSEFMKDVYDTIHIVALPRGAMAILVNRYSEYLS